MIPPIEPSSDIRVMAAGLFQVYVGLTNAGFSEEAALELVGRFLISAAGGDK